MIYVNVMLKGCAEALPAFSELFYQHKTDIEKAFKAATDARSAVDAGNEWLETLRNEWQKSEPSATLRAYVFAAVRVAQASARQMLSVSDADISVRPKPVKPMKARKRFMRYLSYAPCAFALALGVWLLFDSRIIPALIAALIGLASLLAIRFQTTPAYIEPDVSAQPRVNAAEHLRWFEDSLRPLDDIISEYESEAHANVPPRALLESAQTLMEAHLTSDGDFALKAIPLLTDALKRMDIEAIMYDADTARYFDLLPAIDGGYTIRPALVMNGEALLRGQATESE